MQRLVAELATGVPIAPLRGEWQKIAIARAYMREAELLILDEPTAPTAQPLQQRGRYAELLELQAAGYR